MKEWEKFEKIIKSLKDSQNLTTPKPPIAQQSKAISVPIEGTSFPPKIQQDIEIIPENPTEGIVLKIEEIPPLDVFYSPKHRDVVKTQRKKRKTNQGPFLTPHDEMLNVVWKLEVNPSEDLTKLSQYAGAYTIAKMDKASEVSQLIKEKDQRITQPEVQSAEEQQRISQPKQKLT